MKLTGFVPHIWRTFTDISNNSDGCQIHRKGTTKSVQSKWRGPREEMLVGILLKFKRWKKERPKKFHPTFQKGSDTWRAKRALNRRVSLRDGWNSRVSSLIFEGLLRISLITPMSAKSTERERPKACKVSEGAGGEEMLVRILSKFERWGKKEGPRKFHPN
jgi:hypothetical protein